MRLNVEISAKTNWYDDKLRRRMKRSITEAINVVLDSMENDNAELNSLRFIVPTTRRRKAPRS